MKDTMGIIYAAENDVDFKDLTNRRANAAVPYGGRYRIIDFIISSMVNSGISNIGIITQNNYSSLMDHLGSGKEWDLNRKHDGLFILPPFISNKNVGVYNGSIDALYSIMSYIRRSTQKYVVFSGAHMVCNIVFDEALKFHVERRADVTVIYKEIQDIAREELKKYTLLQTHRDGRVWDMEVNPTNPRSNNVFMKMIIMEKRVLEELIEECAARRMSDFVNDVLLKRVDSLKIYGYPYTGYLARMDSIKNYYQHSMELLDPDVRKVLFFEPGLIYTKIKNEVPAKYTETANAKNSIIADGCIIKGEVENSILFRGVKVAKGAKIVNSIVMQDTIVEENAILESAILDKDVTIRKGKRITGQESYPVVIGKGEII